MRPAPTPAPAPPSAIVLTDADPQASLPPRAKGLCPACRAPEGERMLNTGFGRVAKELCGRCGHVFGEVPL